MSRHFFLRAAWTFALATAPLVGTVASATSPNIDIRFKDSQQFTDIGTNRNNADQTLHELEKAFQKLGQRYVAENQTLKIEVLDVTLAGRDRLLPPPYDEIRVLKGRADWPVIKLHYTLEANGQTLRSGNDTLADMDYLRRPQATSQNESLYYEKRMIEDWYRDHFAADKKN